MDIIISYARSNHRLHEYMLVYDFDYTQRKIENDDRVEKWIYKYDVYISSVDTKSQISMEQSIISTRKTEKIERQVFEPFII